MTKIKIGFLGAGYIAGVHAAILTRDERVKVAAIHDVFLEQSRLYYSDQGAGPEPIGGRQRRIAGGDAQSAAVGN